MLWWQTAVALRAGAMRCLHMRGDRRKAVLGQQPEVQAVAGSDA
jgi:hypothetical protein